jgi:hypothetical protein
MHTQKNRPIKDLAFDFSGLPLAKEMSITSRIVKPRRAV